MKYKGIHTHGGVGGTKRRRPPHVCGGARSALPLYIFIHISMYLSSFYKLFFFEICAPGTSQSDKWGGLGGLPPPFIASRGPRAADFKETNL